MSAGWFPSAHKRQTYFAAQGVQREFICILAKEANTILDLFSHIAGFMHGPQTLQVEEDWMKRGH